MKIRYCYYLTVCMLFLYGCGNKPTASVLIEFPSYDISGPRLLPLPDFVQSSDDILHEIEVITSSAITEQVANSLIEDGFADRFIAPYKLEYEPDVIAELLSKNLRVTHEPSDRLALTIRYSHADLEIAVKVANSVANHYVDYNMQLRMREYLKEIETLRELADLQREKVDAISSKVGQFTKQDKGRPVIDGTKIRERLGKLVVDKRTMEAVISDPKNIGSTEYKDVKKRVSQIESESSQLEALLAEKHQRLIEYNSLKRDLDVQSSHLSALEERLSKYRTVVGPYYPRYPRVQISKAGSIE